MGVRQAIRWGTRHAIIRYSVGRKAARGDLTAALMVDPAVVADPWASYDALRARGPLHDNGLVLHTAHHDVATAVLRSPDFGVVGGPAGRAPRWLRLAVAAGGPGPLGPVTPPSMLAVDAPDHTRYRRLVTRAFTARAVATLRTRTEEIAHGLLDAMDGDRADLIDDYAALLPATVIAEMLGAPVEMRRQFLEWGAGAALSLDAGLSPREFRRSERDLAALQEWMLGHFDHVRAHPGDNILSALVHAHSTDGVLSTDELTSIAMLVLAAGFETTVNLIGNGAALLTAHRDQLDVLRADPARWPRAVDEVLRHDSPVQRTGRIALRDTELAGEHVRAGRIVVVMLGGANRDPAVFADPGRFDVTRSNAGDHIAFSSGIHYCLGAALARMEGEVGLRALFDRFPDLTPAGPPHRRPTRVLRGYDTMPVRLTRATVDA
ncbi:MAG: Putative cytochrome P450 hydroxylase [uncultured Pseudonocardia sp.]|uniref:Cytochrome P450 hydroxylase n=1 Tax=uncultured Pseudonocardia sp. TaxID=211455 RepID=A0A6J4P5G1_9PSEU|nr:MAG: Putative cytochrome P450 hydroxylase [uncultured Pseudonocardia sp.]